MSAPSGSRSGAQEDPASPSRRKLRLLTGSVPSPGALRPLATALIELAMALISQGEKSK